MLLGTNWGYAPLLILGMVGLLFIMNPKGVLNFKDYKPSMGGSLFDNNLEFSKGAVIATRIAGVFWILVGVFLFLLLTLDINLLDLI